MDFYADKMSEKWNAQDVIRANAQAEAQEMERLRMQVAEYDARLQELRKLNLKNLELTEQIQDYVKQCEGKLASFESPASVKPAGLSEEALAEMKKALSESADAKHAEVLDQIHKEGVKVYRNVQAIVDDGNKKTQECVANKKVKSSGVFVLVLLNFLLTCGLVTYEVLKFLGVL